MTTRSLIVLITVGAALLGTASWAFYQRSVAVERAAAIQDEQRRLVEERDRVLRSQDGGMVQRWNGGKKDLGPCACQPGDPLCSCL